jgi:hypothetical protein
MDALKARIGTSVRMVAVLAFLIGMPLWALSGSKLSFSLHDAPAAAVPAANPAAGPRVTTGKSRRDRSNGRGELDAAEEKKWLESTVGAKKTTAAHSPDDRSGLTPHAHHLPVVQDQMREIQQRLVAKGADAMLLELLDSNPASYRFWCQMPISTSSMYGRRFEAVAADPVSAMLQVVGQVDAWLARRR